MSGTVTWGGRLGHVDLNLPVMHDVLDFIILLHLQSSMKFRENILLFSHGRVAHSTRPKCRCLGGILCFQCPCVSESSIAGVFTQVE